MRLLVLLTLTTLVVSGCTGPDDAGTEEEDVDPNVVTSPDDYTYVGNATLDNGGHIHNYWGSQDRLVILDQEDAGRFTWNGDPIPIFSFRPEFADVVPQGTASVEVTMSWDASQTSLYSTPELWVKSAADEEAVYIQDLEQDATVVLESSNDMNDLPHQTLSGWVFEFRTGPDPATNQVVPMLFEGSATAKVEVVRGLDIPVYPAHPDRWDDQTAIELFHVEDVESQYQGDPTTGEWGCLGGECPWIMTPEDGLIVPWDAHRVEFVLNQDPVLPTQLGLAFHGGEAFEFQRPDPTEDNGEGTRTYVVEVDQIMADGPYALQSLWEFTPYPEEPEENGWVVQEYDLTVTVYKDPA